MKWIGGILWIVLISVLLAACSKGGYSTQEEDPNHIVDISDTTNPVIEISTPTDNQEIKSGTTFSITGKIIDNSIYQGTINITEEVTGATLKNQVYEIHGLSSYNYNLSYTHSASTSITLIITVEFEDHGFNKSSKSIKVKVVP